jgi:hypothetical protein
MGSRREEDGKKAGVGQDVPACSSSGSASVPYTKVRHPSRRLELRSRGYGIGGGYERPYRKDKDAQKKALRGNYGPVPHSGYYGGGTGARRFEVGRAGFGEELDWYKKQYGEETSGYEEGK